MTGHDPRTEFLRFRAEGDAAALARVFDALAPRLLLLALHLSRNRADAEDLVQETFVAAMDSADRFDPGRDLGRWFAGILGKRALELRRRRARARTATPADTPPDDPADRAAERETLERIDAALANLPAPQREVLVLRLHHGLTGREIARALGRGIDTVHTQIRRGLETLRRRLPSSLAVAATSMAETERGLAQIRAAVLAKAPPAVAVGTGGGWLALLGLTALTTMKKVLIACAALALLTVGWSVLPGARGGVPETPSREDRPVAHPEELSDTRASDSTRSVPRIAVPDSSSIDKRPETSRTAFLVGRCVDGVDGLPVAHAKVRVHISHPPSRPEEVRRKTETRDSASDATGVFRFDDPAPPGAWLKVVVTAPGFAAFTSDRTTLPDFAHLDLGDINLVRGWKAAGRVLDREGKPLGEALEFTLDVSPRGWQRGDFRPMTRITADASGYFQDDRFLPPGHLTVHPDSGWQVVRCEPPRFEGGTAWPPLTIVLERNPQRVAGTVVDLQGRPIAGAIVQGLSNGRQIGNTGTDKQGRFVLHPDSQVEGGCELRASETVFGPTPRERQPATWGETDVRLEIPRATRVVLRVTDARTGEPIAERISINIEHASGGGYRSGGMPDGRYPIAVPDGDYLLGVAFEGADYYAPALVSVRAPTDHLGILEVPLEPLTECGLRVVDEEGQGVASSKVWVIRPLVARPRPEGPWIQSGEGALPSEKHDGLILDHTATNDRGFATIRAPDPRDPVWLLVRGRHASWFRPVDLRNDEPLTIQVGS